MLTFSVPSIISKVFFSIDTISIFKTFQVCPKEMIYRFNNPTHSMRYCPEYQVKDVPLHKLG